MKTDEEILSAAKSLRGQAYSLPEFSVFGDDNTEAIEELNSWAVAMEVFLENRIHTAKEVRDWVEGRGCIDIEDCL